MIQVWTSRSFIRRPTQRQNHAINVGSRRNSRGLGVSPFPDPNRDKPHLKVKRGLIPTTAPSWTSGTNFVVAGKRARQTLIHAYAIINRIHDKNARWHVGTLTKFGLICRLDHVTRLKPCCCGFRLKHFSVWLHYLVISS